MKKFVTLLVCLSCLFAIACAQSESKDPVVAKVGKVKIYRSEVEKRIENIPPAHRATYDTPSGREQVLQSMINQQMFALKGEKLKLDKTERFQNNYDKRVSPLLLQFYHRRLIDDKATPTEAEVNVYYNEHQTEFKELEAVTLKHIYIKEDEAKANEVYALLQAQPDSFNVFVKKYSEDENNKARGGFLGTFHRDDFIHGIGKDPHFHEVVFATEAGQITPVIKVPNGYHIVKVTAHHPERIPTLAEVEPKIRAKLTTTKKQHLQDHLRRELWADYKVKMDTVVIHRFVNKDSTALSDDSVFFTHQLETFTKADLDAFLAEMMPYNRARYFQESVLTEFLESRIYQKVALDAARKMKIHKESEVKDVLTLIRNEVLAMEAYAREVQESLQVTDEDMQEAYEEMKDRFLVKESVTLKRIGILSAKTKADELLDVIQAGNHNFDELFASYNEDESLVQREGIVGKVHENSLIPGIGRHGIMSDRAFKTEPGHFIDQVFQTTNADSATVYHLIFVESHEEEHYRPLDEVHSIVERQVKMEKQKSLLDERVAEYEKEFKVQKFEDNLYDILQADEYMKKAEELQAAEKPQQAISYYDLVLRYYPQTDQAYKALFMEGFLYAETIGNKDLAVEKFTSLLNDYQEGPFHEDAQIMLDELQGKIDIENIIRNSSEE